MAFGQSPTTTTEGPIASNQIFISSVATPNTANGDLTALEGGPISTDSNSNKTAPASMYVKDGNDVTQGSAGDANTVNSVMGRLTKIRDLLNATLTVAISGNVTEVNSASIKADLDAILTALDDGQETMANSLSVAIASDQSAVPVSGTFWQTTQPISGSVSVSNFPGTQAVIGTVTANQGGTWATSQQVASSGGSVPYHNLSAATTNFTNVKGVACQMYGFDISNTSASTIFVKFYDKATAPGTGDTPKRTVQIPANATVLRAIPEGLKFTTGFGWAATGGVADNDNTAIAANCVIDFSLSS